MKPTPSSLPPSLCIDELINHVLRIYSITDSFTNNVNCINKYQKERQREREKGGGIASHAPQSTARRNSRKERKKKKRKRRTRCSFFLFFLNRWGKTRSRSDSRYHPSLGNNRGMVAGPDNRSVANRGERG